VVAAVVSFGVVFGVATATGGEDAPAPSVKAPAVPALETGDATLGKSAPLPALRPARRRPRAAPAPAPASPAPQPDPEPAPTVPAPAAPAPVAPAPRPQPSPNPQATPRPNPGESFDDSG